MSNYREPVSEWLTPKRPLNWDEMGSSAKDLWEARMRRSWERGYR